MNQNFEINAHESTEPVSKYAIAIRYGFLLGFISMFLKTISYLYLLNWNFFVFGIGRFFMIITPLVFYVLVSIKTRNFLKSNINIKDIFQKVFIVILISLTINSLYGIFYVKFIDTNCLVREKSAMLEFFVQKKAPQEVIDEQIRKIQYAIDNGPTISEFIYSHMQDIINHSIFGFIVALIVSRKKPAAQQ
jgi:hypothetical protein